MNTSSQTAKRADLSELSRKNSIKEPLISLQSSTGLPSPVSGLRRLLSILIAGLALSGCSSHTELKWNQEEGYRWAEVSPGYFGSTGFEQLDPSSTNIRFTNIATEENVSENRNYLNGSGVAAADVDGDGLVDLYFAQLDGPNKLYRNLGGLEFEDITEEAGVALESYTSSGVVFADVDGDSDPDLLTTSLLETNELFINDGQGHFERRAGSGLGESKGSNTMALADIDGDEDLDLYITNYKLKTARDIFTAQELEPRNTVRMEGDSLVVIPPYDEYYGIIQTEGQSYRNEYGEEDELYLNDGEGFYEKVNPEKYFFESDGSPKGLYPDWGLTAKFQDINGDLYPDLYVANDFWTPDRIWINRGDGTFKAIERNAIRSMSFSSMGVDFSDINRDGSVDFFVTEMLSADHTRRMRQMADHLDPIDGRPQYNKNSLYLNRGDDTFAEIAYHSNLEASEWSWATRFLDINLDGYEDLIVTTGNGNDYQDIDTQLEMQRQDQVNSRATGSILRYPVLELTNRMFRNNGDLTFTEMSSEWGFSDEDISLGLAVADLDNDGDPDFAINRLNRVAGVYENQTNAPRIAVRLKGESPNTDGVGAKIELLGGPVPQKKEIAAGGDYVSGSRPEVWFAADAGNENHLLTVTWRNGKISRVDSVRANRIYVLEEPGTAGHIAGQSSETSSSPMFEDVTGRIGHTHHEAPYNDFNVQALLPQQLSRQGPGASWIDFDRDGDDDLFIGSGKGGSTGIFLNDGEGNFSPVSIEGLSREASGDQTSILGWSANEQTQILVGSSNYEQGAADVPSVFQYRLNGDGEVNRRELPGILSSTGPLAAADYDGDGDIDLFVGGNFNPAHYPENATSRLFVNEGGTFVRDETNSRKLADIGLVAAACFSDYDRDGDPDLLVAREWGSIVLLENRDGNFNDVSSGLGLDALEGWWNGITTGDFNNDGLPDIVAGNIGTNTPYQLDTGNPLKLYYSDFNRDNRLDIVDAYYDPGIGDYVPRRRLYEFDSIPTIFRNVQTHTDYARSSVDEIFGRDFSKIPSKQINEVRHMVFINGGESFEPKPLPAPSQFSAAVHIGVADVDSDGNEDLFLSQNFFAVPPGKPRQDAGRALLLRGDGEGNFQPIDGSLSGIRIYGEQRGAAFGDFNRDRKVDLVVTQNEGETKLYQNRTEREGLRIRLVGPSANRDAVGSSIRIVYRDGSKGPAREIRAGSGYWSQDSAVQVMGVKDGREPAGIEVAWFDGSSEQVEIPEGDGDMVIRFLGGSKD